MGGAVRVRAWARELPHVWPSSYGTWALRGASTSIGLAMRERGVVVSSLRLRCARPVPHLPHGPSWFGRSWCRNGCRGQDWRFGVLRHENACCLAKNRGIGSRFGQEQVDWGRMWSRCRGLGSPECTKRAILATQPFCVRRSALNAQSWPACRPHAERHLILLAACGGVSSASDWFAVRVRPYYIRSACRHRARRLYGHRVIAGGRGLPAWR